MNHTNIEWVKNPDGTPGYTWNPITGCLNGCPYCYARKLANGRLKQRYLANNNLAPTIGDGPTPYNTSRLIDSLDPFYPRFWEGRLAELEDLNLVLAERREFGKPRGIFVCDMSDLFGIGIPEEWAEAILKLIDDNNNFDRFYLLTRRPQNLIKFSPFPDNCWVGVTITSCLDGLYPLKEVKAKVKFISFEPLQYYNIDPVTAATYLKEAGIRWVIIGAQTKPYKPPKIEWVEEIVKAADGAGIPVFLKNNLLIEHDKALAQGLWGLKKRQEMPR